MELPSDESKTAAPKQESNSGNAADSKPGLKPDLEKKPEESTRGLTSQEARARLDKFGPNSMPHMGVHPLRMALAKFWAPVPWMLEAAIVLELVLGKYIEGSIIAALLVFNAVLGLVQESRAQATLAALKSRLALNASVRAMACGKLWPRPNWYQVI